MNGRECPTRILKDLHCGSSTVLGTILHLNLVRLVRLDLVTRSVRLATQYHGLGCLDGLELLGARCLRVARLEDHGLLVCHHQVRRRSHFKAAEDSSLPTSCVIFLP